MPLIGDGTSAEAGQAFAILVGVAGPQRKGKLGITISVRIAQKSGLHVLIRHDLSTSLLNTKMSQN